MTRGQSVWARLRAQTVLGPYVNHTTNEWCWQPFCGDMRPLDPGLASAGALAPRALAGGLIGGLLRGWLYGWGFMGGAYGDLRDHSAHG